MSEKTKCGLTAHKVVYWPGNDPLPMCVDHANWMEKVASALGLYVRTEQPKPGAVCESQTEDKRAEAVDG